MKRSIVCSALCLLSVTAQADLQCREAWLREPPPKASVLAGYAQLHNTAAKPLIITGVDVAGFERAEIHRTELKAGVARMVSVEHLTIEPNASAILEPGAMHMMLFRPRHTLHAGDKVSWYFTTNQGPQRCTAMVEK